MVSSEMSDWFEKEQEDTDLYHVWEIREVPYSDIRCDDPTVFIPLDGLPSKKLNTQRILDWCLPIQLNDSTNFDVSLYVAGSAEYLDTLSKSALEDVLAVIKK